MSEGPTIGDWTQYEWIPDGVSSFPARVRLRDAAWMVYYEPDVTDLKAEVLLLRKENKELREFAARMARALDITIVSYDPDWCESCCAAEFKCRAPEDGGETCCPAWARLRELGVVKW